MKYSIYDISKLQRYVDCLKRGYKKNLLDDVWRVDLIRSSAELKHWKRQLKINSAGFYVSKWP